MAMKSKPRVNRSESANLGQAMTKPLAKAPVTASPMVSPTSLEQGAASMKEASRDGQRVPGKRSLSVYIDEGVWARAHSAFMIEKAFGEAGAEGSYGRWVEQILRRKVEEVEAARNGGIPFSTGAASLPPGRK